MIARLANLKAEIPLLKKKKKAGYTRTPVLFLKEAQVQAVLSYIRTIPF